MFAKGFGFSQGDLEAIVWSQAESPNPNLASPGSRLVWLLKLKVKGESIVEGAVVMVLLKDPYESRQVVDSEHFGM